MTAKPALDVPRAGQNHLQGRLAGPAATEVTEPVDPPTGLAPGLLPRSAPRQVSAATHGVASVHRLGDSARVEHVPSALG